MTIESLSHLEILPFKLIITDNFLELLLLLITSLD